VTKPIWTRQLTPLEMSEFLDYVGTLQPAYVIYDGVLEAKRSQGGKLLIKMQDAHKREAIYIKTKWG
jgi:hypothetical protein